MMRDEFYALGIPAQCRQPDPLACYERQASCEPSDAQPCLYCPVASWITAMVVSDSWMSDSSGLEQQAISAQSFEPNTLKATGEDLVFFDEAELWAKAA